MKNLEDFYVGIMNIEASYTSIIVEILFIENNLDKSIIKFNIF